MLVAVTVADRKYAVGETFVLNSRRAFKLQSFDGTFVDRRHAGDEVGIEENLGASARGHGIVARINEK
jgi:hypothetical protein